MVACSVASHSSQGKKEIETVSPLPQKTGKDSLPKEYVAIDSLKTRNLPDKDTFQKTNDTLSAVSPSSQQDSFAAADSLTDKAALLTDSTVLSSDSTAMSQDSTAASKPMFTDIITYRADDSVKFSILEKKMFLYKNAFIKYLSTELTADYIELDMANNIAYASGVADSSGVLQGKPKFKDRNQEFESLDLKYNFKTGKGVIKEIITQQGEGYVQGKLTKKMTDSLYCVKNGLYTTCDQHDHPHFYIRMNKAILIKDKKVISGFANLNIEGVPLPLAIPFGFFPITKKGTSGILMPTYGEEKMRGFNLRNGGYYWFISDYVDLALTGTIYTNGSWGLDAGSNYRKRYKFTGQFNFSMSRNHTSEKGTPDYTESKDWSVRWNHNQDPKANPYTTFSASVDMSSASNNYYNSTNINDIANQRKQSSISWSKKWPDKPFNLTASFTHNQNSRDTSISLSLPNVNFRVSQIYPLRRKERVGKIKWYENIGFTYNAELRNSIQTKESELGESFKHMARDWNNGFKHSIPLSTSINIAKDLSLTPSINYNGVAYLSSIRRGNWVTDSTVAGYGYTPIDTIYGLHYAHNYNTSVGLSYNPTIYGMFQFKPDSKVFAIRHVIRPSASITYTPNLGVDPDKYYKTYLDRNGKPVRYSIFDGKTYGTPTGSTRSQQTGTLNLSVDNNVEMKVRNDKDTTGKEEFKKVKLLESFRIQSSYNIFADSMRWSMIQLSARTKVFNNKVNINLSGTLDPYAISPSAVRYNKYHGGVGRLTRVTASSGIQFSSDNGKKKMEKNDRLNGHYDEYMDFEVPWSISLDYTFNYSKNYAPNPAANATRPITNTTISQMVRINGDFSLTPRWKLGYSTGYDFQQKEVTATSFNITRDLHCWEMTFSCIPFGTHQSYNFQINVRSSLLQDLKLTKKDSWYDRR
ncbi:putative LPS assembly protein LptD [Odoribacter sp. Z80]|uniref:putative LPS assembly protein LptD n=1 Tax=Odoribacter sp. Z80 TaxID=2304575 RepID=UPI00192A265F|nr:putative LPS assembly protein LptD [Odoribacter sp. Z80]